MWNKFPNDDIFILHADMGVFEDDWFEKLKKYIKEYPKAGMIGCVSESMTVIEAWSLSVS